MRLSNSPMQASAVAAAAILITACGQEQAVEERPPPSVIVQPVVQKEITDTVEYIGQTLAVNQVSIRARVSGYVEQRSFREGEDVELGEELEPLGLLLGRTGGPAAGRRPGGCATPGDWERWLTGR